MNWPDPEDIEKDMADDNCMERDIAPYYYKEEEIRKTGKCEKFKEFYIK